MRLGLVFLSLLCACAASTQGGARPSEWAQPLTLGGVPNLHQVDEGLYRSAQPSAEGMRSLEGMGIRTILNLRHFHGDEEELAGTRLRGERVAMLPFWEREEDIARALRIMLDPSRRPLLLHCRDGADRTGLLCAIYRIVEQGWSREEAMREMREGGYGFHESWVNLVIYLDEFDPAAFAVDNQSKE